MLSVRAQECESSDPSKGCLWKVKLSLSSPSLRFHFAGISVTRCLSYSLPEVQGLATKERSNTALHLKQGSMELGFTQLCWDLTFYATRTSSFSTFPCALRFSFMHSLFSFWQRRGFKHIPLIFLSLTPCFSILCSNNERQQTMQKHWGCLIKSKLASAMSREREANKAGVLVICRLFKNAGQSRQQLCCTMRSVTVRMVSEQEFSTVDGGNRRRRQPVTVLNWNFLSWFRT